MVSFYCLNCGKKSFDIPRNQGETKEKWHRKMLYCPWCHQTLNHIQCMSDEEAFLFREAFEEGKFIEEAKESINFVGVDIL